MVSKLHPSCFCYSLSLILFLQCNEVRDIYPVCQIVCGVTTVNDVVSLATGGIHCGVFFGVRLPAFVSEHQTETQHPGDGGHSG